VLELQQHNERLERELNVDRRNKADNERHAREELDRQLRITKEELDNKSEQLRVTLEDKGNAALNERSKEVRRLETVIAKLRSREEGLEGDLLQAQNEIVRLRFETEHSELRLQRWQRRVRELESLPLAVGKAEASEGKSRKTKEEEEMERFVRSQKTALEKLHRENENLRANSASNAKYMDMVRENKNFKQALADRDREIVTLGDKLNGLRDQVVFLPFLRVHPAPSLSSSPRLSLSLSLFLRSLVFAEIIPGARATIVGMCRSADMRTQFRKRRAHSFLRTHGVKRASRTHSECMLRALSVHCLGRWRRRASWTRSAGR
jgi:DNA repair exonuclease SbcCD ATPase subunit